MVSCKIIKRIYLSIAALIIAMLLYLYFSDAVPLLAYFLMLDFSVWCVGVLFDSAYQKREMSLMKLMEECKIEEFIEKYSHEHEKDTREGFNPNSSINLAAAYMHSGVLDSSLEMLKEIKLPKLRKKRRNFLGTLTLYFIYHNNISCTYLRLHNANEAKLHMEKARDYLRQLKDMEIKRRQKNPDIDFFNRSLDVREIEFNLENGIEIDYEGEIDKIKNWIDIEENKLKKVSLNYLLYVIYIKNGNLDEAGKCSEFIKKNGGDTCYVKFVG